MHKLFVAFAMGIGLFGFVSSSFAAPVEYTKVCTSIGNLTLGPGYYYLPGTDMCFNPTTGEVLQVVQVSDSSVIVWKTRMPYPRGTWATDPAQACQQGNLVKVGDFHSTDFVPDSFVRLRTNTPVPLSLNSNQMIMSVIMRGGFYNPNGPARGGDGVTYGLGLCLRSLDSTVTETQQSGPPLNPPYGDGGLPIGCIENEHIVNMPAAYAIPATSAYPNIDAYFVNNDSQAPVAGPYTYGKQLVVTTDIGRFGAALTYCPPNATDCAVGPYDASTQTYGPSGADLAPLAGTLSVWACVGTVSANAIGGGQ